MANSKTPLSDAIYYNYIQIFEKMKNKYVRNGWTTYSSGRRRHQTKGI